MAASAHWPAGVQNITLEQLDVLGVGPDNRLYWDGRPVVTEQRLVLTAWQKFWSGIAVLAAITGGIGGALQGVDSGHDFACKFGWIERGCLAAFTTADEPMEEPAPR